MQCYDAEDGQCSIKACQWNERRVLELGRKDKEPHCEHIIVQSTKWSQIICIKVNIGGLTKEDGWCRQSI